MQVRSLIFSLAALVLPLASVAHADWTTADSLFAQRENNRDAIQQARAQYLAILNSTTDKNEKVRAASQLGRLALYEGEMLLPKSDVAGRAAIFKQCWCADPVVTVPFVSGSCRAPGFIEKISAAAIGEERPEYHYLRGVCVGYWGEVANLSEKAVFAKTLKDNITKGPAVADPTFDGGGVFRMTAAVQSNPQARGVGLYDARASLAAIDRALATPDGPNYYENWQTKIQVLKQLADDEGGDYKQKAIDLAEQTLDQMDILREAGTYPEGRRGEFNYSYGRIKTFYKELSGQDW